MPGLDREERQVNRKAPKPSVCPVCGEAGYPFVDMLLASGEQLHYDTLPAKRCVAHIPALNTSGHYRYVIWGHGPEMVTWLPGRWVPAVTSPLAFEHGSGPALTGTQQPAPGPD